MPPKNVAVEWERHRSFIIDSYLVQERRLDEVKELVEDRDPQFIKTKRQYEHQLKKWGVGKKVPVGVWPYVVHQVRKRKLRGERYRVFLHGCLLPEDRLRRELQRYSEIPAAKDFGARAHSPSAPGEHIVQVRSRSPSIMELDPWWWEQLGWFNFNDRFDTLFSESTHPLDVVVRAFGSYSCTVQKLTESTQSLWYLSTQLGNHAKFRVWMQNHLGVIPAKSQDVNRPTEAVIKSTDSREMAKDTLKIIFYHLSNNLDNYERYVEQQHHDKFIVHLVEALLSFSSHVLLDLFSDRCPTSNAIKESIFASAVRERDHAIVSRLLMSGVDPNLRIQTFRSIKDLKLRRGKLELHQKENEFVASGVSFAALTHDVRLMNILLGVNANPNGNGEGPSPLSILAQGSHFDDSEHLAALNLARALLERGAQLEPDIMKCPHGSRARRASPYQLAIAWHNNELAELLVVEAHSTNVSTPHMCAGAACSPSFDPIWAISLYRNLGIRVTPLGVAIASNNTQMTERLLHYVTSKPLTMRPSMPDILILSCLAGDNNTALKLLALGVPLDDGYRISPLVAAAWNPDVTIASRLLELGADSGPSEPGDVSFVTPLHVAAFFNNAALAKQLINRGASCQATYHGYRLGQSRGATPLHCAIKTRSTATIAILTQNSSIDDSVLVQAIEAECEIVISIAISLGEDILLAVDAQGCYPVLEAAIEWQRLDIVNLFFSHGGKYQSRALLKLVNTATTLQGIDPSWLDVTTKLLSHRSQLDVDIFESIALIIAFREQRLWELATLLLCELNPGPSALYLSQEYRNSLHEFIENEIPWELRWEYPEPNLSLIGFTFQSGNIACIETMIQQGYPILQEDIDGVAEVDFLTLKAVVEMLQSKFDMHDLDEIYYRRDLLYAIKEHDAQRANNCIKLVSSLDFNYKINFLRDRDSKYSPLGLAVFSNQPGIILSLLDAGASIDFPSFVGCVNVLDVMENDESFVFQALHIAVHIQNLELVRLLVSHGSDINKSFPDSPTALQIASKQDNLNIVRYLCDHGADINAPPNDSESLNATALQFAAISGHLDTARFLIERGADIDAIPLLWGSRTALEGAAENGRLDMVQLLLERGAKISNEMRIYYVRSVNFARRGGHGALARFLQTQGSWTEKDDELSKEPHILDESVVFRFNAQCGTWTPRWLKGWINDDGAWENCSVSWSSFNSMWKDRPSYVRFDDSAQDDESGQVATGKIEPAIRRVSSRIAEGTLIYMNPEASPGSNHTYEDPLPSRELNESRITELVDDEHDNGVDQEAIQTTLSKPTCKETGTRHEIDGNQTESNGAWVNRWLATVDGLDLVGPDDRAPVHMSETVVVHDAFFGAEGVENIWDI
ncbi:ankyrin repeat-containing domain protein [Xylaria telfairii]|nr:ankyrin repeat-containing domain protein [Xylaria telfairii]